MQTQTGMQTGAQALVRGRWLSLMAATGSAARLAGVSAAGSAARPGPGRRAFSTGSSSEPLTTKKNNSLPMLTAGALATGGAAYYLYSTSSSSSTSNDSAAKQAAAAAGEAGMLAADGLEDLPLPKLPPVPRLLSDAEIRHVLTANEALLVPKPSAKAAADAAATAASSSSSSSGSGSGKRPVRIDINSVASNAPCEDYHAEAMLGSGLLVGIIDGHAGPDCGKVLSTFLLPYVARAITAASIPKEAGPARSKAIEDAITAGFVQMDADIVNASFTTLPTHATDGSVGPAAVVSSTSGSVASWLFGLTGPTRSAALASLRTALAGACAIVAYLDGDDIYVASTGDSRAVLGRRIPYAKDGSGYSFVPTALSMDHTARNPGEYARMAEEHPGEEVFSRGRVLGGLMPTRAFGDSRYKWSLETLLGVMEHFPKNTRRIPRNYRTPPYVTAKPQVVHYTRTSSDDFLILATDGLWDELSNEKCVAVVGRHMDSGAATTGTGTEAGAAAGTASLAARSNAATQLMRSALGGGRIVPHEEHLRHILSIPNGPSRYYRDDITVSVIHFGASADGVAGSGKPHAKPVKDVDVKLGAPKQHQLANWLKALGTTAPTPPTPALPRSRL
ncbi:phosphatase 2C-like domain-containing protein [Entophlyctis helioformis]|nr:phosphatase 2C-like domain-containing protein [Entophlyctis helioformis]